MNECRWAACHRGVIELVKSDSYLHELAVVKRILEIICKVTIDLITAKVH